MLGVSIVAGPVRLLLLVLVLVVQVLWRPFPDPLPRPAVLLHRPDHGRTRAGCPSGGRRRTTALWLMGVVALAISAAAQVNQQFQAYPELPGVLGMALPAQVPHADLPRGPRPVVATQPCQPLSAVWRSPRDRPRAGVVTTVDIPGPDRPPALRGQPGRLPCCQPAGRAVPAALPG